MKYLSRVRENEISYNIVIQAKNLGAGTDDSLSPYCVAKYNGERWTSSKDSGTMKPVWNYSLRMYVWIWIFLM